MSTAEFALVIGAGLLGGFVNAIAGGGSLLLFPALVATGMSSVSANVTNSVALWPGYAGNVVALGRADLPARPEPDFGATLRLMAAAMAGSAAGCAILLTTPVRAFTVVVPFLVLGASALLALQSRIKSALALRGRPADRPTHLRLAAFAGGVYGGYFGGGLGVILMAVLGLTSSAPLRRTNAIKGLLQLVIASVSLAAFAVFGPVHWLAVLAVAPAALLGGVIGGRSARALSETALRTCVVAFGVAVGIWLAVRAFG